MGDVRDFELRIGRPGSDGTFPVAVTVQPGDQRADGALKLPFDADAITRALTWMEQGLFEADYVRSFGGDLFKAVFTGDVEKVYTSVVEGASVGAGVDVGAGSGAGAGAGIGSGEGSASGTVRYRLVIADPAVARVPWELLFDPGRGVFLALEGTLVRNINTPEPTAPLTVERPLRVLVVTASPAGVPPVQDWLESSGIRQALSGLVRQRRAVFEVLQHATLEKLQNTLREANNPDQPRPIHLVHFVGHGAYVEADDRSVLLFEKEAPSSAQGQPGAADPVDAEALANVIAPYGVKLVFLNACQSLQSSGMDMARGMAPTLLGRRIPAVIGMQVTVLDEEAVHFALVFYEALADNLPVDAALTEARRVTRGTGYRRKADMGIPVCYLRTQDGHIFEVKQPQAPPLTRATWREWLRAQLTPAKAMVGGIGAIGLASGLLALYQASFDPHVHERLFGPEPMSGDLNIAVAQFGVDPAGRSPDTEREAAALSQSVYDFLNTEVKGFTSAITTSAGAGQLAFDLREPGRIGRIDGLDPASRGQAAKALAQRIRADVIVYGNVAGEAGHIRLQPELYLSDRSLVLAEEMAGQYDFGQALRSSGDIGANPVARAEFRSRLEARIRAIAQFVIGLGYFALRDYPAAKAYFAAAAANPNWSDTDGKEVLYFFMGNTAVGLHAWDDAGANFARSLAIQPEYARSRLGAAEVVFQRAHADCSPGLADAAGLQKAADGFQDALAAKIQPALSNVPTNVAIGLGRTYLCQSQAGFAQRWGDAAAELQKVVDAYNAGNQRIKEEAVEAQANLGLIQILKPAAGDRRAQLGAAVEAYESAIRLDRELDVPRPQRQAVFQVWQGFAYVKLDDCDLARARLGLADTSYAQATQKDPTYAPFRADVAARFAGACGGGGGSGSGNGSGSGDGSGSGSSNGSGSGSGDGSA